MAYKNKEDLKKFQREWYIKNRIRILKKARINNKIYLARNKKYVDELKLSKGCADCGYNKNPVALDFDHLKDKINSVARLVGHYHSIKFLEKEIAKCEVVCSNCHRIRTHNRLMAKKVNAATSKVVN